MRKHWFLLLALCGCDSVRHTLSLDHYEADAYKVAPSNIPLTVPPDFCLHPPLPQQGHNPQVAQYAAQKAIHVNAPMPSTVSGPERKLLANIKQNHPITPGIRKITEDEYQKVKGMPEFIQKARRNLKASNPPPSEITLAKPGRPNGVVTHPPSEGYNSPTERTMNPEQRVATSPELGVNSDVQGVFSQDAGKVIP